MKIDKQQVQQGDKKMADIRNIKCFGKKKKTYSRTEFCCERDGLVIRGTEYRPKGDRLPVAVVCHGFMAYQDTVKQYAMALAELGYLACTFDFCGGSVIKGKSGGRTTEMSVLTEIRDLECVLRYVTGKSYADPDNITVMGCSQGGFVSALTAAKGIFPVKKLVLFYPAFCIPYDARAGKMLWASFHPQHIPETFRCGPMKLGACYVKDVIEMKPYREIQGYAGDVLIVHGAKDKLVHPKYSKRAFRAYRRSGAARKVRFEILKNGKHGFSKKADKQAVSILREFMTAQ